ncbi:MAG TPA: glutamate--tRNA ligase [Acidimicrobiales bacterium]|nr:glutamate--tRNA ligase [Acidimicrobiales bacterium]
MRTPRVRFAPSPTGFLHVGSARTALFNWLFARQQGGTFVLRIEDTDTERNREEWAEGILSSLAWLGMEPDEGPFRQSARVERHHVAVDALWEAGFLYACGCTREEVDARTKGNPTPGYDGHCRGRGLERGPGRALRFRTPEEGTTVVHDVIRGDVVFPHHAMEDFVVVKSGGQPLFVLANVIDDRDMEITHVIRGEDLLPSTPKGILIWESLDSAAEGEAGWGERTEIPMFAHLPLLVNEQRKKLSKRRDPVAVESYRDQGYLPQAFMNFLALLGWSPPGGEEKVPIETLIEAFRLEDVHHAPAFFDVQKLTHLNGEYLRDLTTEEFIAAARPWVDPVASEWRPSTGGPPWPPMHFDEEVFAGIAPAVQERVTTLGEVPGMVDFLFLDDPDVDEQSWNKAVAGDEAAPAIIQAALDAYATCEWEPDALHEVTNELAERAGRKLAKAQAPIRVAVMGRTRGLPLFDSLAVLGREETRRRLAAARSRLAPSG